MGKNQIQLNISNNISVLRAEFQVSQQALADEINVTRATISSIEKGKYNPSLELAFKIAIYFKKDINDIFSVEDGNE
jgi:putative transcriptional regulator